MGSHRIALAFPAPEEAGEFAFGVGGSGEDAGGVPAGAAEEAPVTHDEPAVAGRLQPRGVEARAARTGPVFEVDRVCLGIRHSLAV